MTDSEIITATKRRLKLYTDDSELDSELQSMLNGCRSDLESSGVVFPEAQNNPLFLETFIIYVSSFMFSDTQKNIELGNLYNSFIIKLRNTVKPAETP